MTNDTFIVFFLDTLRNTYIIRISVFIQKNNLVTICIFPNTPDTRFYNVWGSVLTAPPEYPYFSIFGGGDAQPEPFPNVYFSKISPHKSSIW